MLNSYSDIRNKINELPQWWDESGVPRYVKFHPHQTANIYADEAVLVEIACQSCGTKFLVCFSHCTMDAINGHPQLSEAIRKGAIHYGDPPNTGCCAAGATMNCEDLRVIEYWHKPNAFDWERDASLEIQIPDGVERLMPTDRAAE